MKDGTKGGLSSMHLSEEKEKEIFSRCFNMVDCLNEAAVNIIMDFFQNTSCPMAKQLLRNSPEVIALKAFEKAIQDFNEVLRRPDVRVN